ncbi:MAG: aminotransferase class I/II-fold pyridoxal phosphate-dependent enzyme [Eubacteriales bacterium]
MAELIMAEENGRNIPLEDKIFGISQKAKAMQKERGKDNVIDATIGALLDDEGNLIVLSSVDEVLKNLRPEEYAAYAPIAGTAEFKKYVQKCAFGTFEPTCFTEAVASPGGTGAIRNAVSNYSKAGDKILVADWFWANYTTIADQQGRKVQIFTFLDDNGNFNVDSFAREMDKLLELQDSLLIIVNTPAQNPTGYAISGNDWDNLLDVITSNKFYEKKISLVVDVAYIDFAGDPDEVRKFYKKLDNLPKNILPMIAYSLSKTFTLYGMRSGALICMAKTKEIADEFVRVNQASSRACWSNCNRLPMTILTKIYEDEKLLKKVDEERKHYRDLLLERGFAFAKEAENVGLAMVPFKGGFFATIPCKNSAQAAEKLQEQGIFLIPLEKGLRVSIASISKARCEELPAKILAVM